LQGIYCHLFREF